MPRRQRHGCDRRILREDRLLEPFQIRARLQPQFLPQHAPRLLEGLKRFRLATAAVESEHQLPPQTLAERILLQCLAQLRQDLAMLAEHKRRLELLLERVDAQPLEPPGLAGEPRHLGKSLQRGASVQRARRGDRCGCRVRIALAQRGAPLRQQLLELQRVDARVGQHISVRRRNDRRVAEGGAQARHVMLYRVPRGRGQVRPPQRVDQLLHGHDPPSPKGEERKQGITLASGHSHRAPARRNLERAENPDLERIDHAKDSPQVSHARPAPVERLARRSPCG